MNRNSEDKALLSVIAKELINVNRIDANVSKQNCSVIVVAIPVLAVVIRLIVKMHVQCTLNYDDI